MKVYPKEHQGRERIYPLRIPVDPKRIEKKIPDNKQKKGKNVRPCQPVEIGRADNENEKHRIREDIPPVSSQDPEQQGIGRGKENDEEQNHAREAECPVNQCHYHFGKPLVSYPGKRGITIGEDIVPRHGMGVQDELPDTDVKGRIPVTQKRDPGIE